MLHIFGVHGPQANPKRLAAMIAAMDRALDPAVYAAVRDLAPDPSLQIRLRAIDPARVAAGVATEGALTVAGKVRLYDEAGPPGSDLHRLADALARDPTDYPHRTGEFEVFAYDFNRRELRLAVDAFGSMPIYYARFGDVLAFANWPHLLLALPDLSLELDPVAAAAYLAFVPQPKDRTFFKGLHRLVPAQSLTRGEDRPETFAIHWRPCPASQTASLDDVAEAVSKAIRGRLHHTSRPALELSGGLDSSLIAGFATRLRPDLRIQALSNILPADYEGDQLDERDYIEAVLAKNPSIASGYVTSDGTDIFCDAGGSWDRLATPCFDEYRFITDRALVLAGDADGVFSGYGGDQCLSAMGAPYFYEMLTRGRIGEALREWSSIRRFYGIGRVSLLHYLVFTRLPIYPVWRSLRGATPVYDPLKSMADPDVLAHLRRWNYRRHTAHDASMLAREMKGVAGIEDWTARDFDAPRTGRSIPNLQPLIDPRVIEAVLAAPTSLKVSGDRDRALIRAIGADVMPPMVVNRIDKMGFSPDYLTLLTARAPEIAKAFARYRKNPLWREYVDADVADAALAELVSEPTERKFDVFLGQVVRSHFFGLFLERAFD